MHTDTRFAWSSPVRTEPYTVMDLGRSFKLRHVDAESIAPVLLFSSMGAFLEARGCTISPHCMLNWHTTNAAIPQAPTQCGTARLVFVAISIRTSAQYQALFSMPSRLRFQAR